MIPFLRILENKNLKLILFHFLMVLCVGGGTGLYGTPPYYYLGTLGLHLVRIDFFLICVGHSTHQSLFCKILSINFQTLKNMVSQNLFFFGLR
jgi:hypothetical protein